MGFPWHLSVQYWTPSKIGMASPDGLIRFGAARGPEHAIRNRRAGEESSLRKIAPLRWEPHRTPIRLPRCSKAAYPLTPPSPRVVGRQGPAIVCQAGPSVLYRSRCCLTVAIEGGPPRLRPRCAAYRTFGRSGHTRSQRLCSTPLRTGCPCGRTPRLF
jgi:hypothetical protein